MSIQTEVDLFWQLLASGLLVFVIAGLLFLTLGQASFGNRVNAVSRTLAGLAVGVLAFWLVGFGISFGKSFSGVFGWSGFIPSFMDSAPTYPAFFIYQFLTAAIVVLLSSTPVANRLRFGSHLCWSALMAGLVYPICAHVVWNGVDKELPGGWLLTSGFIDFGGSSAVCFVAACAALALLVGAGRSKPVHTKNIKALIVDRQRLAWKACGVLLLWLGWSGMTGGRFFEMHESVGRVMAVTFLAGGAGLVLSLLPSLLIRRTAPLHYMIAGCLAGLAAISASAHLVPAGSAALIGGVAGILVPFVDRFLIRIKVEDSTLITPALLVGGAWGVVAVALYGDPEVLGLERTVGERIALQAVGVFTTGILAFGIPYLLLRVVSLFVNPWASEQAQREGLDETEHGVADPMSDIIEIMELHAQYKSLDEGIPNAEAHGIQNLAVAYQRVVDALVDSSGFARALFNTVPDGVIAFSVDTLRVTRLNSAAGVILGAPSESIAGREVTRFIDLKSVPGPDGEAVEPVTWLDRCCKSGGPVEIRVVRPNGTDFKATFCFTKALLKDGPHYVTVFRENVEGRGVAWLPKKPAQAEKPAKKQETSSLKPIVVPELLNQLCDSVHSIFDGRGSHLNRSWSPDLGIMTGDRNRIRGLLLGILTYAANSTQRAQAALAAKVFKHPETKDDWYCFRLILDKHVNIYAQAGEEATHPLQKAEAEAKRLGGFLATEADEEKPTRIDLFLPVIGVEAKELVASSEPVAAPEGGINVLLVEDDERYRMVIRKLLSDDHCQVIEAADGQAALQILKEYQINLVLLDLSMPQMDGFQFVDHLREMPVEKRPPIIVLSGQELTLEEAARLKDSTRAVLPKRQDPIPKIASEIKSILASQARLSGGVDS